MQLPSGLFATVVLLAACSPDAPKDPSSTVAHLSSELEQHGPAVLYEALPASYQRDLQQRLTRLQARLSALDKGTWKAGVDCLRAASVLAKIHGRALLKRLPIPMTLGADGVELFLRRGADALLLASKGALASIESWPVADPGNFFRGEGREIWRWALQALRGVGQLTQAQLEKLRCSPRPGTGQYLLDSPWGQLEGAWQQVEGRWLPAQLIQSWPAWMARCDSLLAGMEGEDFRRRWHAAKPSLRLLLPQLKALQKSEDPIADLQKMLQLFRGMAPALGRLLRPGSGR